MAEESRRGLGRGLAALLGDNAPEAEPRATAQDQRLVPIEFLRPNARNPRKAFDEEALEELASSIRERGLIQPIVVRLVPHAVNAYEIIAGERRWRAAQRAGLHNVPIHVMEADDRTVMELAIIENVQRADLNPIEEAMGYEQLMGDFSYTQNDLARIIGKSRSHVANTLRLMKLPDLTKKFLADGSLTAGHARALLALPDPDAVAQRAVSQGLSVRDLERLSQEAPEHKPKKSHKLTGEKDPNTRMLEQQLNEATGLTVTIDHKENGGGQLVVKYKNLDQLDALVERLSRSLNLKG
ncbi:MAG: Chromosome partitioning protein ParB [Hyphomicrobiales bacterium]|nr:Chromosome partitioning protein ParB [Hyphomicrobiales bacterium]